MRQMRIRPTSQQAFHHGTRLEGPIKFDRLVKHLLEYTSQLLAKSLAIVK
jgi:hypothetical protein